MQTIEVFQQTIEVFQMETASEQLLKTSIDHREIEEKRSFSNGQDVVAADNGCR